MLYSLSQLPCATHSVSAGTSNSIVMDSDSDSDNIISISSNDSEDNDLDFFEVKIKPAHKKTLTIPLAFWQHHHLDSKERVYMRFGNAATSYAIQLRYTHESRPGCSDSLKLSTGWPRFFDHCKMLMKEGWKFTIVSNTYGPQHTDFLFQSDLIQTNY